jgi:hypothetical protein
MSYYDNVKDDVQDKGDSSKPNFDTLREAAEEHSENEEKQEGDDTEIEVLNETGLKDKSTTQSQQKQQQPTQQQRNKQQRKQPSQNRQQVGSQQQTSQASQNTANQDQQAVDSSGVEEKLDKIIEQNQKMIEILESFGN